MDKDKIICSCFNVSCEDIENAINEGASSLEEVQDALSCGSGCGCCDDEVKELCDQLLTNK